ncbi:MAG: hypothetical protein OXF49_00330 [Candidatus Saccharibacteria bacterium]|nr:hypothetical protein [Candidatus Saccharibacteria bacterium]
MRRCTNCQAQVLETDKFCSQCSKSLSLDISQTQTHLISPEQAQNSPQAQIASNPIQPQPPIYQPMANQTQNPVHPAQALTQPDSSQQNSSPIYSERPVTGGQFPQAQSPHPAQVVPQSINTQPQQPYQPFPPHHAPPINQIYKPSTPNPQSPLMTIPSHISHQSTVSRSPEVPQSQLPKLNLKYYKRSRRPRSRLRITIFILLIFSLLISASVSYFTLFQTSYNLPSGFAYAGLDCSQMSEADFNQIYKQALANAEKLRLSFDSGELSQLEAEVAEVRRGSYQCITQDHTYNLYHRQALADLVLAVIQTGANTDLDWGFLCSNQSLIGDFNQIFNIDLKALDFAIEIPPSNQGSLANSELIKNFNQSNISYEVNFDICQN